MTNYPQTIFAAHARGRRGAISKMLMPAIDVRATRGPQNSYPHFKVPTMKSFYMNANAFNTAQNAAAGFDLVRLSKSKQAVDLCSNTMSAYNRAGLPFYKRGKAVFFSKVELATFIRANQNVG